MSEPTTPPHPPQEGNETQSLRIVDRTGEPVLALDADAYRQYVEDFDLSEDQENELLQAIWTIIVQFVDLGFGIESVQQVLEDKKHTDSGSQESRSGKMKPELLSEGVE